MPIKKCIAALSVGSLICMTVLGLRTSAGRAGEVRARDPGDQGPGPTDPDDQDAEHGQGDGDVHQDVERGSRPR